MTFTGGPQHRQGEGRAGERAQSAARPVPFVRTDTCRLVVLVALHSDEVERVRRCAAWEVLVVATQRTAEVREKLGRPLLATPPEVPGYTLRTLHTLTPNPHLQDTQEVGRRRAVVLADVGSETLDTVQHDAVRQEHRGYVWL